MEVVYKFRYRSNSANVPARNVVYWATTDAQGEECARVRADTSRRDWLVMKAAIERPASMVIYWRAQLSGVSG